jgi:nucleotide-binding universal stress UspA family protein
MKRILVPVDFSSTAEKAYHFAMDLASRNESAVILYHVHSSGSPAETEEKRQHKESESRLLGQMEELKKKWSNVYKEIPVSVVLGAGVPCSSILEFASQNKVDMIVMGTQGASGLKKLLAGSVATRIIKKTSLPVLLIPEKFSWKKPRDFVYATSLRPSDKTSLSFVLELARLYGASVRVVYVQKPGSTQDELRFENYAAGMNQAFAHYELKFASIVAASVTEALATLQNNISCDMLVMVRSKVDSFEGLLAKKPTREMACITTHPLLILPEKEEAPVRQDTRAEYRRATEA